MRATVSSEEALASIRQIGRAFGLLPSQAKPPIDQLNASLTSLGRTVQRVGAELRTAVPALGGFGLGAAGAGAAGYALMRTLTGISDRMVELKYRSRELGMSERELRAWGVAAAQVGIAPEAMQQSLSGFKKTTEDFKYRMGAAREELIRMGAGPVVQRITNAATQLDKLKEAFDFKDVLDKMDPTGARGRSFFEQIQLGAGAARLSYEQYVSALEKTKPRTAEQIAEAEKAKAALVLLGEAYDDLTNKAAVVLFPGLTKDIETLTKVLDYLGSITSWRDAWDKKPKELFDFSVGNPMRGLNELQDMEKQGGFKSEGANPLLQVPGGGTQGGGFSPIAFKEGFSSGSDLSEGSRMVKEGTFAALVEFKSYVSGGGGGANGFQSAAFTTGVTGGGGAATAGGGMGGGGASASGGTASTTGGGGAGSGAQLNDEGGKPIDAATMKEAEALGRSGDVKGLQKLFAQKGYRMSGPACGIVASAYVKSAGFKPPSGSAIASTWRGWGEKAEAGDINAPDRPFGSMVASYEHGRYGGKQGKLLGPSETGGHVMTIVPGTYNPKTGKAMFADQYGVRERNVKDMAIRYAGDEAVRQAQARSGEAPATARAPATSGSGGEEKTVRGSWFGPAPGFPRDPTQGGMKGPTGLSIAQPGIALPSKEGLGQMYEVTTPDGRKFTLPQVDIGPFAKGRGIDITAAAASKMGYDSKTFPTDGRFSYRRLDESVGGANVKAEGTVNVNVTAPPGTKSSAHSAGMFQKTTIKNTKQMQPTDSPHVEAGPG
jgi:hypothetical protein